MALLKSGEHEPKYQGRSLAQWLMIYCESDRPNRDRAQGRVAAAAIRAIGTNAVPSLLRWIRYETPPWHRHADEMLPLDLGNSRLARVTLHRSYYRALAAPLGFRLLGTNAVGAIPELSSMTLDQSHPETARRAIEVLSYLGPQGFQALAAVLANTNQPFRGTVAFFMKAGSAPVVGTNTSPTPLKAAMDGPDPTLRPGASNLVKPLTRGQTVTNPPQ